MSEGFSVVFPFLSPHNTREIGHYRKASPIKRIAKKDNVTAQKSKQAGGLLAIRFGIHTFRSNDDAAKTGLFFRVSRCLFVRARLFVGLLVITVFQDRVVLGLEQEGKLTWGVTSLVLKPPWSGTPSLEELLSDREHTILMDRFYRVGGVDRPATPAQCRIAYNGSTLFVVLCCEEKNMAFPTSDLFYPNTNREANWNLLKGSPGGCDSWPPFPDEVDFFIRPDMAAPACYQFSGTPDGSKHGVRWTLNTNSDVSPDQAAAPRNAARPPKVDAFGATVVKRSNDWLVFFQIPWDTLGGTPQSHFGILPIRTRWRDGEFSSPAAIDFEEWMPVDLLIETSLAGGPEGAAAQTSLCRLPSGTLRWQRPALAPYPDVATRQQIWQMESSLSTPTDKSNLAQRLYLTQCWMDLMTQEGFTPLPRAWGELTNNLILAYFRQKVNASFEKNDLEHACQLLDNYLRQLDQMSRWWYADASPGDILAEEWTPVATVDNLQMEGKVLLMQCQAGSHKVDLHLALPKTGGVRIYGSNEGYFKPGELLSLKVSQSSKTCSIKTTDGKIVVNRNPFSVSFFGAKGKEVTQIGANDLSFRFGPDGKVLAIDFRNQLDASEAIYGFGEKYDRFDQHGNTLTLWGTDDWVGNGLGLRDTTYKLVPVIHSSKGYMLFDNSSYRLRGDIGKTEPNQYHLTQQGPIFDFYLWIGTPKKSLESYTALTGRCPLPPKWVFEPWMGRGGGAWASGPLGDPVAEEEYTYNKFQALDIPHSAIYAEGPSANSPDLNKFMAAHHIKVLGYFMPAVRRQASLMPELKEEELPTLRFPDGSIAPSANDSYVDFTHPKAKELCRRYLKPALDAGVAGSMVDFGDMVPDAALFYDGKRGDEMHNFYTYAYHKTMSELYREKRGDDFILYGRAATPGDQKWVGQFAGDHPSDFDGLKAVLTGALNLCATGFSTWGSDLGGYFGLPEPAVYMRWIEFGLFSPIWRPHGKATRDPWYFGDAAVASYKFDAWARENILNYTYNAAVVANETGIPIMRSMPISFPDEPALASVRDEYMFGDDLLIAPVLDEDNFRTIQFPTGLWTSMWDGKTVSGPAEIKVDVPLDTIPAYLKQGAVMTAQLSRDLQFGHSMSSNRVSALVVTPPRENETASVRNAQGEAAQVTMQASAHRSRWRLKNLPETSYLLVYGTTDAAKVKVDGKALPALAAAEFSSMPAGWVADLAGNRLVICLGSDQAQSKSTREIEVDFSPGKK